MNRTGTVPVTLFPNALSLVYRFITPLFALFTTIMDESVPDKAAEAATKKKVTKDREKRQIEFIKGCTLDDVIVDENNRKPLKAS